MSKEAILYVLLGVALGAIGTMIGIQTSTDQDNLVIMSHDAMSMSDMHSALQSKKGDDFDKAFIEMMINHHQGAIDMAELIPERTKHEEIKRLGKDIIVAQTQEINDMRAWAKAWEYSK